VGAGTPDVWSFTRPTDRAEYGAWWGCVVPPGAAPRLGLSAPYFLKWDDAEYGLRARAAGYDVLTLPGLTVRHPTWATKGTSSSWSSWPMHRNRLATAAAYGAGRGVLVDSLVHQVKHVLSLQYLTAELWNAALDEVLAGPGWLDADLTAVRPKAQALIDDAATRRGPARPGRGRRTELASPASFDWRTGLRHGVVTFADGSAPLVRDRRRAWHGLARAVALHARAAVRWRDLRTAYGPALPRSSSVAAWRDRLDAVPPTT
jgi:galactofuranosylgalactofuranosylrhamnosyl-N-acetylglucosaminyl-diphospho-decaprenol beta-1,5/1,6-galactofuranosyltransferase